MPVRIVPRLPSVAPPPAVFRPTPSVNDIRSFPALGTSNTPRPTNPNSAQIASKRSTCDALQKIGTCKTVLTTGNDKTNYHRLPNVLYAFTQGFVYFPDLPDELKALVYEHAMSDSPYTIDIRNFYLNNFPNVCFATVDAMQTYFATRTFHIRHPDDCNTLAMVVTSVRSLDSVGKLVFPDFDSLGGAAENRYIETMKFFPNVHTVTLYGDWDHPAYPGWSSEDDDELSKTDIIERVKDHYNLEELFQCQSLRTIIFSTQSGGVLSRSSQVMLDWIKAQFLERTGMRVTMRVKI